MEMMSDTNNPSNSHQQQQQQERGRRVARPPAREFYVAMTAQFPPDSAPAPSDLNAEEKLIAHWDSCPLPAGTVQAWLQNLQQRRVPLRTLLNSDERWRKEWTSEVARVLEGGGRCRVSKPERMVGPSRRRWVVQRQFHKTDPQWVELAPPARAATRSTLQLQAQLLAQTLARLTATLQSMGEFEHVAQTAGILDLDILRQLATTRETGEDALDAWVARGISQSELLDEDEEHEQRQEPLPAHAPVNRGPRLGGPRRSRRLEGRRHGGRRGTLRGGGTLEEDPSALLPACNCPGSSALLQGGEQWTTFSPTDLARCTVLGTCNDRRWYPHPAWMAEVERAAGLA